jgi:hypothetical protein
MRKTSNGEQLSASLQDFFQVPTLDDSDSLGRYQGQADPWAVPPPWTAKKSFTVENSLVPERDTADTPRPNSDVHSIQPVDPVKSVDALVENCKDATPPNAREQIDSSQTSAPPQPVVSSQPVISSPPRAPSQLGGPFQPGASSQPGSPSRSSPPPQPGPTSPSGTSSQPGPSPQPGRVTYSINPPSQFTLLVSVLNDLRLKGLTSPSWGTVGGELLALKPSIYKDAGVNKFGRYVTLAAEAGIVQLGDNWICLQPKWIRQ